MKQYTRWIVLGVMAVPVGAFLIWPMLNSDPAFISEPTTQTLEPVLNIDSEMELSTNILVSGQHIELSEVEPTLTSVVAPPEIQYPVTPITLVFGDHLTNLLKQNIENDMQLLTTELASNQAQEREAMQRNPDQSAWRDGLDIGDASIAKRSGELDKNDDVLSRIRLASLITVSGYTSASLALDSLQPVRVSVGNEFAGAKVKSITSKGVTLTLGTQTRHLQGASHE